MRHIQVGTGTLAAQDVVIDQECADALQQIERDQQAIRDRARALFKTRIMDYIIRDAELTHGCSMSNHYMFAKDAWHLEIYLPVEWIDEVGVEHPAVLGRIQLEDNGESNLYIGKSIQSCDAFGGISKLLDACDIGYFRTGPPLGSGGGER